MGNANQYTEVSTRGTGKSLKAVTFATTMCLLKPNSKIGLTAVGSSQANENFLTAFMQELVFKYSPFVKWLYDNKLITTKETDKGYVVQFWNGSIIYFFACINSSRGIHIDTLIGEELRLIKKCDWDSIAMPMLVARRAGYRNLPEYIDRIDLDEDTKVITITSNRTKNEWFNTMFNQTFVNYFKDPYTENRVYACDIFLALQHGLKKPQWFLKQQKQMGEIDFKCEILNETLGEVEGSYFTFEQFRKNQVLKNGLRPLSREQFLNKTLKNRPKIDNEYRLLFIDFAFASSTTKVENDNTVIGIMSMFWKNDRLYRQVEYIESHSGGENDNSLLRIREMYWDLDIDYIVMDTRNGGETLFNDLTREFEHPFRPENEWNKHGFTVCNELELQVVSNQKLDDLKARTVDLQAVPCIIPITATKEFNSNMWLDLSLKLKNEYISFLLDKLEFVTKFEESKEYFKYTDEEKADIILPYTQTELLINEAINLKQIWTGGLLKLEEPRTGYKDKIVSLGYGNYIATLLENKLAKLSQNQEGNSWDNIDSLCY